MSGAIGAYCDPTVVERMSLEIEGLRAVTYKILVRLEQVEQRNQHLEQVMTGGVTKGAERAMILVEAARKKGYLKRAEVCSLLDCHHTEALRAMRAAAEMFNDLRVIKNNNRWILEAVNS